MVVVEDEPDLVRTKHHDEDQMDQDFPEGGVHAWLVVVGAWCGTFAALGITNTIAAFQAYVSQHQLIAFDESKIGWIFSLYTFLAFFGGIYIGPIFDKHGPRILVISGSLCITTGIILLSICTEYWHFLVVFGILCGIGCSLLFTPCIAAVGHFFYRRRGLATGVASSGGSIGGIIFPLLLQKLSADPRYGWLWAVRILALLCFALLIVSCLLVRSRLQPSKHASVHPDIHIFKNKVFAVTACAIFLMEFSLFIPLAYITSYTLAQGFDQEFSFEVLTILNAASFLGRTLPGWWADSIGPFNSNIMSVLVSVIACFAVWLPFGHTTAGIVIFAILIGFASGNNISITPTCIGKLCKTQDYGRYYATCFTMVSFACLTGNPIGGVIIAACGGKYWGLIILTGTIYIASLVVFIIAKILAVGWHVRRRF